MVGRPNDFFQAAFSLKPIFQMGVEKPDDVLVVFTKKHHFLTARCDGFALESFFKTIDGSGGEILRVGHSISE